MKSDQRRAGVFCAAVMLGLAASPVRAQLPAPLAPRYVDLGDEVTLLTRADVQQEIEILEYQLDGITRGNEKALQKIRDSYNATRSLSPEVRVQVSSALGDELAQAKLLRMQELLLPHQLQRLSELRWQSHAVRNAVEAFDRAVKLTDEQKEKMRDRENELRERILLKLHEFHERQEREVLNVLTPEQRIEWQKQVGKEFKFETQVPGLQILRRLL